MSRSRRERSGHNRQTLKTLLRLYLIFGISISIFVIAFFLKPVRHNIIAPFTHFVALCSSFLMNIFGAGSGVSGTILSTSLFSIDIVDGCNGIYATAILISGVIAYPSRLKEKLWGIALGALAIFILNQVRVISLFYLGQYYQDIFNEVHVYVWQPLIIVWAILVWDFWSRKIKKEAALEQG